MGTSPEVIVRSWVGLLMVGVGAACTPVHGVVAREMGNGGDAGAVAMAEVDEPGGGTAAPATPAEAMPGLEGDSTVWRTALAAEGSRIVVSREARHLWLLSGDSTVFSAPVAVGRDTIFRYRGTAYDFSTPTGRMMVLGKEESPLWVPPDWHYYEAAVARDLEPVHLKANDRVELSDGTALAVRDGRVGRVNRFGNWAPFTPGSMIIYDGKIFVPPIGSPQRRIPDVLGTHRLILGDGYLIHGTPETETIGREASHGCVRLLNRDVQRLYGMVEPGVPVYIY